MNRYGDLDEISARKIGRFLSVHQRCSSGSVIVRRNVFEIPLFGRSNMYIYIYTDLHHDGNAITMVAR